MDWFCSAWHNEFNAFNNFWTPIFGFLTVIGVIMTIVYSIKQNKLNLYIARLNNAEKALTEVMVRYNSLTYHCSIQNEVPETKYFEDSEKMKPYYGEMAVFKFFFDLEIVHDIKYTDFFYAVSLNNILINLEYMCTEFLYLTEQIYLLKKDEHLTSFPLKKIKQFVGHLIDIRNATYLEDVDKFGKEVFIKSVFDNFDTIIEEYKKLENKLNNHFPNPTQTP